ncbi:anti-sigma factor [Corynebacterium suicordis]
MVSHIDETDTQLSVEHLSLEAIAALADGELSRRAEHRAKVHIVHCEQCRAQVTKQREASERLRENCEVKASGSLIERLSRIPENMDQESRPHQFGVDGCRRPETFIDGVDLLLRKTHKAQRRTK